MKVVKVDAGPLGETSVVSWIDQVGEMRSTVVLVTWHHRDDACHIEAGHYADRVSGDVMSDLDLIDLAVWLDAEREAKLRAGDVDDLFDRSES